MILLPQTPKKEEINIFLKFKIMAYSFLSFAYTNIILEDLQSHPRKTQHAIKLAVGEVRMFVPYGKTP